LDNSNEKDNVKAKQLVERIALGIVMITKNVIRARVQSMENGLIGMSGLNVPLLVEEDRNSAIEHVRVRHMVVIRAAMETSTQQLVIPMIVQNGVDGTIGNNALQHVALDHNPVNETVRVELIALVNVLKHKIATKISVQPGAYGVTTINVQSHVQVEKRHVQENVYVVMTVLQKVVNLQHKKLIVMKINAQPGVPMVHTVNAVYLVVVELSQEAEVVCMEILALTQAPLLTRNHARLKTVQIGVIGVIGANQVCHVVVA